MSIAATGIPSLLSSMPSPMPPILAALNVGHNDAIDKSFAAGGPWAMLKDWGVPAINAGCAGLVVRVLDTPFAWLDSLAEAHAELIGSSPLYLYTRVLDWNIDYLWDNCAALIRWAALNGAEIILEGSGLGAPGAQGGERCWVREALAAAGVLYATEPAIDRNDPWARGYAAVVEDYEWQKNYRAPEGGAPAGWAAAFQIPPWETPGGYLRWYRHGLLYPGVTVLEGCRRHYLECRASGCLGDIIAADFFCEPVDVTVAQIRGMEA